MIRYWRVFTVYCFCRDNSLKAYDSLNASVRKVKKREPGVLPGSLHLLTKTNLITTKNYY